MGKLRNITQIAGGAVTDAAFPVGAIMSFAGPSAPLGWLLCDGTVVAQATYPTLFGIIGATYNIGGEGVGNFRLPDCRQKFILGVAASGTGAVLGQTGGQIDHSHSVPAHHHALGAGADLNIASSGSHTTSLDHDHASFTSSAGTAHTHANTLATSATSHTHAFSLTTDSPGTHNHTIDHDHAAVNTGIESVGHSHTIDHDHASATTGVQSADHSHTINHDHASFSSGGQSSNHTHNWSGTTGSGNSMFHRTVHNAGSGEAGNHTIGYSGGVFADVTDANYLGSNHTHNYSGTTDGDSLTHTHSIDVPNFTGSSGGVSANHTHSVDLPNFTGSSGGVSANHTHSVDLPNYVGSSGFNGAHTHTVTGSITAESAHVHAITGGITNESTHTHSIDVPAFVANSSSSGAHVHATGDFSGRIGNVTSGIDGNAAMASGVQNPPYIALHFIIKA